MNSQNNWYCSPESPRFIHELPFHDEKIGIYSAINAHSITGPTFYDEIINAASYTNNILHSFVTALTEEGRLYSVFQQDSATARMAYIN
jgi:hypothetical protein